MTTDDRRFEGSEFEQVKYKFNRLIEFGKDFGETLIKGNKTNKRTILASLNTPYEHDSDDIKAKRQYNESVLGESMKEFVDQIFKHYDVNPSVDECNERIISTYVNENLEVIPYLRRAIPDVVNEDDKLYNDICALIEKIRKNQPIHQEERKIYITGIRGSGKTSYLNYFMSKHEKDLNKQKIISIRINVRRIEPDDYLEDAIKFKICRILFTYYCTRQQHGEERLQNRTIKNTIDKYLDYIQQNIDYNISPNDINECSDEFKSYNAKETKNIPQQYEKLCDLLLSLVIKEYKFIIMLDDFDQVTPNDEDVYKRRMSELQAINRSALFNHSVYIIAVRYSTFNTIPIRTRTQCSCRVIGTPTTFDMLNKRFDFFVAVSKSELKEKKINCLKNLIVLIGNNFMPNANSTKQSLNFEQACRLFDEIFYGNKRIIVNMIRRFINIIPNDDFEFLCKENYENNYGNIFDRLISQTYYKFFESLLINTETGYCNSFFKYSKENGKYQISPINPTAHFDENFFPNIYHFPATTYSEDVQFIPFLKIRILQLLKSYKTKDIKLTQNEIARKLNNIFGYEKETIHLACKELRWDQSIIIIMEEPDDFVKHKEKIRELKVDITPRGEKMLNILPININLLAVSLENVFFPVSFLQTGMPIGNYNDDDISKFIIRNIYISLPKVIGLLKSIEEYEKNVLLTRNSKMNQDIFNIYSDFTITKQLEEISNQSIERIYRSYFGDKNESDEKFIRRRTELKKRLGIEL